MAFSLALTCSWGQTLTAGDFAIVGFNANDEYVTIAALSDIPSGETVFFTDEEWNGATFNTGEGFLEWITPTISAGDVFTLTTSGMSGITGADQGTLSALTGSFVLGNAGDGVFIYQTDDNTYNSTNVNFLSFAGEDATSAGTLTGTNLTLGYTAIYMGAVNGEYVETRNDQDKDGFLYLINDNSNWITYGNASSLVFDDTDFTFTPGSVCNITFATPTYTCTSETLGANNDQVIVSIPFTDANPTIESVTTSTVGTIGGDNPTTVTNGIITISGLTEGDYWDIVINGGSCDGITLSDTISDVICDPCPNEGDLIITEIMQNPSAVDDAYGEYFEVYNTTDHDIDMIGLTIGSNYAPEEFTITTSLVVAPGAFVVFGKNSDTAANGGVTLDYTYPTTFNLGNSSDRITISCNDDLIDRVAYDDGATFPDPIGASMELNSEHYNSTDNDLGSNWYTATVEYGNGDYGTPGYRVNEWTGAVDTDWFNTANWSNNTVPNSSDAVYIPTAASLTNQPTAATGSITINSLLIGNGSELTIGSGVPIVVTDAAEGIITVERDLTNTWHYISTPVVEASLEDYISSAPLASGTGSNLGLASYTTSSDSYVYATNATNGTWFSGTGYSTLLSSNATVSLTGEFPTNNIAVTLAAGGVRDFNLIGNPYPSYVTVADLLDQNSGVLNENTLWFWENNQFVTINVLNGTNIAPMQGFIVSGSGNFSFTTDMQTVETSTFYKTTNSYTHANVQPETLSMFKLQVANSVNAISATDIYLVSDATTSFDNGYDSSMFSGTASNFGVYTTSVANDVNNKLAIQALPTTGFNQMLIPVGVIANNGGTVTFSLSQIENLPAGVHVYLQDNLNGTTTQLDTFGADYQVTLPTGYNGTGDFFISLTNEALATDSITTNNTQIIASGATVTVVNLEEDATLHLFNMLGQQVTSKKILAANSQDVSFDVTPGTYILSLEASTFKENKKIILKK
ncbi:lamin tail domain-containing protein [Neptunitalea lumnitzerae]|uniref:LTD domain-containing protein n=1 Tax=Neptunitalea lumnitzerae TaxID=2965509 RepID=A0ABQ5MLV0_9FLAO|nr:lamin tail domain-containing protein [Neptunitalea sp. Y10]GLB50343.1 hypothetical protein Y10_27110 [Neptunitalea sp. Y10]